MAKATAETDRWLPGMSVTYRKIAAADSIPELTKLLHRAYRPLADAGLRFLASHQDDATTRERVDCGETIVAVLEGRIVGTVTVRRPQTIDDAPWYTRADVASVEQFAVDPDHQRRGIGSKLMTLAEELATSWGAAEMALDTSEKAGDLIALYEKRGYRVVDRLERDIVNYQSIVLSKRLR